MVVMEPDSADEAHRGRMGRDVRIHCLLKQWTKVDVGKIACPDVEALCGQSGKAGVARIKWPQRYFTL
jgi:hypothetical protein